MRVALVALVVVLLAVVSPASATFPGRNGSLAFYAYEVNEESTDILIEGSFVGIARIGGPRHLLGRGAGPAFSPNGHRLAYAGSGSRRGIWLTRPDCKWPTGRSSPPCSRLRRLTSGDDSSPAWLPNGKRIAFVRGHRIFTIRVSGGGRRFLARGTHPDWSSKGALVFTGRRDALRIREPGGRLRTLPVRGSEPSWAPGGDRFAFLADEPAGEKTAVYTIKTDGTALRKLAEFDNYSVDYWGASSPTWSPDGRWIAFIKGSEPPYTGHVYAVRPSGGPLRLLIPMLADCGPCFGSPNFGALDWQPRRP
jgi:Tol biopolymer transport system component